MKQEEKKGKQTIDTIMREGFSIVTYSGECGRLCTTHMSSRYIVLYSIFISFTCVFGHTYTFIRTYKRQ